jgi:dTDP-4-amino-4,6-dideoxygalactose transaminase
VGAFHSFEWGKPVSFGVGGMLTVNDPGVARAVMTRYAAFRDPGAVRSAKVFVQGLAYRYVLTPRRYWMARRLFHTASSLGLVERNYNPVGDGRVADDFSLRMLPAVRDAHRRGVARGIESFCRQSRRVAAAYAKAFAGARVRPVAVPSGGEVVYARYPLLVEDKPRALALAREMRVELAAWYATPVHPLLRADWSLVSYASGSCARAEERAGQFVSLPLHAKVRERDVERAAALVARL